jgi:hypothetical protein
MGEAKDGFFWWNNNCFSFASVFSPSFFFPRHLKRRVVKTLENKNCGEEGRAGFYWRASGRWCLFSLFFISIDFP